jgi:putative chitinase
VKTDWYDWNSPVSKYFTVGEVTNRDSRRIPRDTLTKRRIKKLAKELDWIREKYNCPITINSWYRPPHINAAVGGVSNSQHIQGWAVDANFVTSQEKKLRIEKDLVVTWNGGVGTGQATKGFTHLDLGKKRRWTY